ncbi:CHAT domain-containing tetratricopeptide repeat protein [Nonomuraea gerenzanensis]|uniref:FOG: TPR repeat n=1 Tax=Nonomuraea gerenzanensis TaxID=93944 RepID=A0A1M4EE07_9ACTN|nr:CHAT domain-containing protein [Nonomuraea gerenzanensis]UBU08844.1 CHAT domain-containing protein [Nonomuraea gerenzanensis]SBO97207.1 FOG: TPR repeat [Nonomuraea gerenzanensis]
MNVSDEERFAECLTAFAARDYRRCATAAKRDDPHWEPPGHLVFRQLLPICVYRLGQGADLDPQRLPILYSLPDHWERALLRLTFGMADLETVWRSATDDERRCQALYYAGARLLTVGDFATARERLLDCLSQGVDCAEARLAEIDLAALDLDDQPELAGQRADIYLDRAQTSILEGRFDAAVDEAGQASQHAGEDAVRRTRALRLRLHALAEADRLAEAMELMPTALETGSAHLREDDPELARLLIIGAHLHNRIGDLDEANRLYRTAADSLDRAPGHRAEQAAALHGLARIASRRRRLEEAELLFQQVFDRVEDLDDDAGLGATALVDLANVRGARGDHEAEERLHLRALDRQRERFGADHHLFAQVLSDLGRLRLAQGRFAEAERLLTRAADIQSRVLGRLHPDTLATFAALLEMYEATGQHKAVEDLPHRILTGAEPSWGDDIPAPHPLPELTPMFQVLESLLPETARRPEAVGGAPGQWSPDDQRLFGTVAADFAEGDHGACVLDAIQLNARQATHEALQLFLMCQTLGTASGDMEALISQPVFTELPTQIADPWYSALVALTLGQSGPDEVARLADDDEKACQLLFYTAQRRMSQGHVQEALHGLLDCAGTGVPCFETWMADRLLRAAPRASDRALAAQVRELNRTTVRLLGRADFAAALGSAQAAWRLADGLEVNSPERTSSHYHLAVAVYRTGDRDRAGALLRDLVTQARQAPGRDHVAVARALGVLGVIHIDLARYPQAISALRDALEEIQLAERPDDAVRAQILADLAEVHREMRDLPTAIRLGQEAVETQRAALGGRHPDHARTLGNLGLMYEETGDSQRAEALLTESGEILRNELPSHHPDITANARALAAVYARQGRLDEAERVLQQVSHGDESATHEDALCLAGLGNVAALRGDLGEARRAFEQSRSILERAAGPLHPDSVTVTLCLAILTAWADDPRGALDLVQQSEEGTSRLLLDVFTIAAERQRLQLLENVHARLSVLLSLVGAAGMPDQAVADAFDLVLRRKGIDGEVQRAWRASMDDEDHPDLRPKMEQLRSLQAKVAGATLSGPGPEGRKAHSEVLAGWRQDKERLEAELAGAVPHLRLGQRLASVSGQQVVALLAEGSALVEFVRFQVLPDTAPETGASRRPARHRYWAFVLRPQAGLRLVDLGDADEIDRLVATYRQAIITAAGTGEVPAVPPSDQARDVPPLVAAPAPQSELDAGLRLRSAVFDPLRTALGDDRTLFLCPDGDLSRLPWEVLPLGPDRRLTDEYAISYLGTARDLVRLSAPAAQEPTAPLVVADPDFWWQTTAAPAQEQAADRGSRAAHDLRWLNVQFAALPGAAAEGEEVAKLLGVKAVTGRDATEGTVRSCRRPAILHLATHGFSLPGPEGQNRPEPVLTDELAELLTGLGRLSNASASPFLRSGLALAGANTWLAGGVLPAEADDGILTAEEVSGMDLDGTRLVVLSACKTALGAQHPVEGVLGLRRAFTLAGARTVVTSLWQVPDTETRYLMEIFYKQLMAGRSPADALRAAQSKLRGSHPEPFFWGAFVCHGDPGTPGGPS